MKAYVLVYSRNTEKHENDKNMLTFQKLPSCRKIEVEAVFL